MDGRALVLGSGGVTGIAWETGLIAGLAERGIDLAAADVIIGTSAGSVVGTDIACGREPEALYQAQLAPPAPEPAARMGWDAIGRLLWVMSTSRDPVRARARLGHWALAAPTMPEASRRKVFQDRLPASDWPATMLKVTAVNARTGQFVVFDAAGEAGLVDAVAASCAVPGVWPPVTIGGRRFVDGGVRSAANADLAAGYERVLIVAPVAQGIGHMTSPAGRPPRSARPGPASRLCGQTARPCTPSGTTCLTCPAGPRRQRPAGPRPRRQRPRSGPSGSPAAGRLPPDKGNGRSLRQRCLPGRRRTISAMAEWWSIEVLHGEFSAFRWQEQHDSGLIEAALTNGAVDGAWHADTWGVAFEVCFGHEEQWEAFRSLPAVRAALDAVPDPVNGLLVYRGRGGGAPARQPRKPKPTPSASAVSRPEPEAGQYVDLTNISPPDPAHAGTASR